MIQLKPLIIDEANWLEATWVDVEQKPDKGAIETQIYCQFFHPTQINLLRDKAGEYGTPLTEYEQMLADWVNSYVPEPPTPAEPVPRSCTPAQGLVALYAVKGITEDNVRAAIEAIPDDVQRYTASMAFERATVWQEGSPTMQMMQSAFAFTDADMDELFDYAVQVKV